MAQRSCLNEKRLTQKQVQALVAADAQIHEEYTNVLYQASGQVQRDVVYRLPEERFLLVFDPNGISLPGKGDIYPKAYFIQLVHSLQRAEQDWAHRRANSVDHWRFYSHAQSELIQQATALTEYLAKALHLAPNQLDKSYKSLDLVSQACAALSLEHLFTQLYDAIVAYVGEVIRTRVQGEWAINTTHSGGPYPFISIGFENVRYMPLNAVYYAFSALDRIDFRKQAANEVRRHSGEAELARKATNI